MAEAPRTKRARPNSPSEEGNGKLRYTEPDLRVVIHYDDESGKPAEKVYPLYAQNLARLSSFVDASLSNEMRERTRMEITFHSISPRLFEKAIKYLEDPLAIRSMTPEDALELVCFYDQYHFSGGLLLCDEILSEYIDQQSQRDDADPPENLDLLVEATAQSHKYNLPKSRREGVSYLNSKFSTDGESPFGATMFSEDNMRLLQPLFLEGLLDLPDDFSTEDLESSMFPKYFVKCMACDFATKTTQYITLQGTGTHDGKFRLERGSFIAPFREETVSWGQGWVRAYLTIQKSELCHNDWAILCRRVEGDQTPHVMWKCPYSKNLALPPAGPWLRVEAATSVDRKPRIRHY